MSSVAVYRKVKEIKDTSFSIDRMHEYALSLVLGDCDFQISVLDIPTGKLVFFEDYTFGKYCSADDQLTQLQRLFDKHFFLHAGFWKTVNVVIKNDQFVQIPAALFSDKEVLKYLTLNAEVDRKRDRVLYCRSKHCDLVTVFAAGNKLLSWIQHKYTRSKVAFFHQVAGLIEGVHIDSEKHKKSPLYLYIDRFRLHILFMQRGELIYYNQFVIHEFSDYIKYIMLVMEMMKLNAKTSHVVLWGYVEKKSPHLMAFSNYLRNVSLGSRPDHLKFGYVFDELEDHQFFDLYSMYHLFH